MIDPATLFAGCMIQYLAHLPSVNIPASKNTLVILLNSSIASVGASTITLSIIGSVAAQIITDSLNHLTLFGTTLKIQEVNQMLAGNL